MTKIVDIYNYIDSFAPFDTAMDFDNVGILVGDKNAEPTRAIVTLDITDEVVAEAKKNLHSLLSATTLLYSIRLKGFLRIALFISLHRAEYL